ncbi:MAG: pyridoxamine 5'-phosphate oxidase [Gemmatimonadetes bacterium]|nr:pyridoxamine 5'-phosphate oxidase [Gemmatimonadota bacterium]
MSSFKLPDEVVTRFAAAMDRVRATDLAEPTAVVLATADASGQPSSRTVLLKSVDARGFVFYTNTRSRKGRQLAENPRASLTFYWPPLAEQVQAEGRIEPVAVAEADEYWATRDRGSQVGAWASDQSQPLGAREELEARVAEFDKKFDGAPVPRPPHWSGFRLVPERVEFWKGQASRLHDRELWERDGDRWAKRFLNP